VILPPKPFELWWAPCKACIVSVTFSLQLAKAGSAATLPQQEKNNSADVQPGRVSITGFIYTVENWLMRRCTFDEFESIAVASRWRWRMFQPFHCRLRLQHKSRRGPLAALPGAGVWQHALGNGAHCPCAAHRAALNGNISLSKCTATRTC
jgi:hypothetical protein